MAAIHKDAREVGHDGCDVDTVASPALEVWLVDKLPGELYDAHGQKTSGSVSDCSRTLRFPDTDTVPIARRAP